VKTRSELDQLAWKIIEEQPLAKGVPPGYAASGRPANFQELAYMTEVTGDFERSWSEYRHEFYRYRTATFFAVEPPKSFSPELRAMLAGAAEYLSDRFGLPVPGWTSHPEYFLDRVWDPWEDIVPDIEQYRDERRARSHQAFLRRNVIFETRGLISL
jgi:hypothetical protein